MRVNKPKTCRYCGGPCDYRVSRCRACKDKGLGVPTAKDRLLSKILRNESTDCWEFTGYLLPNGYGRIAGRRGEGPNLAHRVSWLVHRGEIPAGMLVCHTCDNRKCVNPDHLFLGTQSDNLQDMKSKGRGKIPNPLPTTRGESHWKNKLTKEQVSEIRSRSSESRKALAVEFKTTPRYISSIISGTKWKWLKGSKRL